GTAVGYSMKGGDFSWPPVGTFRGHQRGPQLATSRYFLMATDITVPVYRAFHSWLGRNTLLKPMWDKWDEGDRKGATEAVPDEVIDNLIVYGSPAACRESISHYVANGTTTPVLSMISLEGIDPWPYIEALTGH
ncbi:MAG: LLM class flavin-dependent oxidoreductase, partial [Acidimicrobiales bacterium]